MPRINIEEKWWSDPRRGRLAEKLGRRVADGLMLEAWRISQEFNGNTFSWKIYFDEVEVQAMLSVGLAELHGENLYIKGSKEHHDWIKEQRRRASLGGQATKRKNNSLQEAPATPTLGPPLGQSLGPPSPSPSPSLEHTLKTPFLTEHDSLLPSVKNKVSFFVGRYVKAYQKKYGKTARPDLRGKVQGQIRAFLKDVPLDRACSLIEVYLQMPDKWFETKCHDFSTFLENQNKIALGLDTGKSNPSRKSVEEILSEEMHGTQVIRA